MGRLYAWLRPVVSVIAFFAVTLIAYGAVYNLGRPRNPDPDPLLAIRLLPLELLIGLLAGWLAYRAFGRGERAAPRADTQERMLTRLALRRGGAFTMQDVAEASPLTDAQARETLTRMQSNGRLVREGDTYRLRA